MEYFEPKSIGDALSVLAKHGAAAKVIPPERTTPRLFRGTPLALYTAER